MLVVALVATLASAALWQQWRHTEVEQAERARLQARWILTGALDWARLILREDARTNLNTGAGDHLAEPWAVGLEEARLSSFLAADKAQSLPDDLDAFLSGDITDLQSRLNASNLVRDGLLSEPDLRTWVRLFDQLGLNTTELRQAASQLVAAQRAQTARSNTPDGGNTAPPLVPQRVAQLSWLGLSAATLQRLAPFVTVLPERTAVNLNTASAEVLVASVAGLDLATARRTVTQRALQPFKTLADAGGLLPANALKDGEHSTSSRYFLVTGRLRLNTGTVAEQSLVQRNGLDVKTLWRERLVLPRPAPTAASLQ